LPVAEILSAPATWASPRSDDHVSTFDGTLPVVVRPNLIVDPLFHVEVDRMREHASWLPARELRADPQSNCPKPELERYFDRFGDVLRRAHAPKAKINALHDQLCDTGASRERLPCPHCLMRGRSE
jgi:hypothetical protein